MQARPDSTVTFGVAFHRVRMGALRTNSARISESIRSLVGGEGRIDVYVTPPYPLTGPVVGYYPTQQRTKSMLSSSVERFNRNGGGRTSTTLRRIAMQSGVPILAGPVLERAGPKTYVTAFLVDEHGEIVAKYRKIAVTRSERMHNISEGKEVTVFDVAGARVGVFIDEDLVVPEIFRVFQALKVNIVVGFMLPYESDYFKRGRLEVPSLETMDVEEVRAFLYSYAKILGVPIVLVGGVVEDTNGRMDVAFMPPLIAEPDLGKVEVARGYEDIGRPFRIEVDSSSSVARECDVGCSIGVTNVCRKVSSRGRKPAAQA